MSYQRKTIDEYEIQGYYSSQYGFEVVNTEMSYKEAKRSIREYRENEPGTNFRIKLKRVKKD